MERSRCPGRNDRVAAQARLVRPHAELRQLHERSGPPSPSAVKTATWAQGWLVSFVHGADRSRATHPRDAQPEVG